MFSFVNLTLGLIIDYGKSLKDSGSISVQIAILTYKIKYIQKHLNIHKKDYQSRRGLLYAVSSRKRLLNYIKNKNIKHYIFLLKKLDLRH